MKGRRGLMGFMAVWAVGVLVLGGALASYHLPFRSPSPSILALAQPAAGHRWQVVHVLSGSCACSQRVMRHLLDRRPTQDVDEQVLLIGGEEPDLPETVSLLEGLKQAGFPVRLLAAKDVPANAGLHGLPLLVVASPERKVAYLGGYGMRGDQDTHILQQVRSGAVPQVLAVAGCAIGTRLRRKADPLHLKY